MSVVQGPAASGKGVFKGVCSNYLASRLAGDVIHGSIRATKAGFHLPENPMAPILMIGPGTGLAPFRGFLQQRAAQKAEGQRLGPAMLFFGCRNPDEDFLYAEELKGFEAEGLVELRVAFSRTGATKTYVQDLIAAEATRVGEFIDAGATIYVCGDGSKMEPDVKRALTSIHAARTGADEAAAAQWIDEMGAKGRYVLDVWVGS